MVNKFVLDIACSLNTEFLSSDNNSTNQIKCIFIIIRGAVMGFLNAP